MPEYNEQIQVPVIKKKARRSRGKIFLILLVTHLLVGFGGWSYGNYTKVTTAVGLVTELQPKEVESYVKKVAALIAIPKDEVPKVIVLNNAAEIAKQQPFFVGTKDGDVFLAFNKTKKAIIYRPSENIIINVGPIYDEPVANQVSSDQSKSTTPARANTETDSSASSPTKDKSVGTTSATKSVNN